MLSSFIFLILQISGALIAPLVFVPMEFRPPLSATPGVIDIGLILVLATIGAVILILMKFVIPLRILSHFVVMFSGFYLGSFFGTIQGILLGTLSIILRLSNNIWLNNLATSISAIAFGLLIGYFVDPGFSLLLIASLSVYDAIGVLYSKHIQAIWLAKVNKDESGLKITKEKVLDGILMAIPTRRGYEITGVGDYALPLVLVISVAKLNLLAGVIVALFSALGYNQMRSVRGQVLPGMPFIGVGCTLGLILVKALSLI
jgi:presenilin-like A22 family membrane protease